MSRIQSELTTRVKLGRTEATLLSTGLLYLVHYRFVSQHIPSIVIRCGCCSKRLLIVCCPHPCCSPSCRLSSPLPVPCRITQRESMESPSLCLDQVERNVSRHVDLMLGELSMGPPVRTSPEKAEPSIVRPFPHLPSPSQAKRH